MIKVTKEILKEAAHKMLFEMSEEEYDTLFEEFKVITKQMELISSIPGIDNVEPMIFPFECTNDYLRDDVVGEQLSVEEALGNAKDVIEGQIRLPKVVG